MKTTIATAIKPPAKAKPWTATTGNDRKIASTAPSAAPLETPRMSGETSGLRNRFWYTAPAAASAPPINTAAIARGMRISNMTASNVVGNWCVPPVSLAQSIAISSAGLIAKRPTDNATISSTISKASVMIVNIGALNFICGSAKPAGSRIPHHLAQSMNIVTRQRLRITLERRFGGERHQYLPWRIEKACS